MKKEREKSVYATYNGVMNHSVLVAFLLFLLPTFVLRLKIAAVHSLQTGPLQKFLKKMNILEACHDQSLVSAIAGK